MSPDAVVVFPLADGATRGGEPSEALQRAAQRVHRLDRIARPARLGGSVLAACGVLLELPSGVRTFLVVLGVLAFVSGMAWTVTRGRQAVLDADHAAGIPVPRDHGEVAAQMAAMIRQAWVEMRDLVAEGAAPRELRRRLELDSAEVERTMRSLRRLWLAGRTGAWEETAAALTDTNGLAGRVIRSCGDVGFTWTRR